MGSRPPSQKYHKNVVCGRCRLCILSTEDHSNWSMAQTAKPSTQFQHPQHAPVLRLRQPGDSPVSVESRELGLCAQHYRCSIPTHAPLCAILQSRSSTLHALSGQSQEPWKLARQKQRRANRIGSHMVVSQCSLHG